MSIGSLFHKVTHAIGSLFSADNLTAAEKYVASVMPDVGDQLAAISKDLPDAFNSLLDLAKQAQALVKSVKGHDISLSIAIHLAQAVLTAHWPEVVAEAEALVAKL